MPLFSQTMESIFQLVSGIRDATSKEIVWSDCGMKRCVAFRVGKGHNAATTS